MKKIIIYFTAAIALCSCGQLQTSSSDNGDTSLVVVKDYNSTKQGFGNNVVAEVANNSNKTVSFVSVEFTWRDKAGALITSQKGNTSNIQPHSTGMVDSYFDEMPKGATYSAKVNEVIF